MRKNLVLLLLLLSPAAYAAEGGGAPLGVLLGGIGAGWLVSALGLAKDPRLGALLAGLMGLGVSLYLGMQHVQTGAMSCNVNDTFDCGSVVRSEYSAIAGVPIAFLGSGFYAGAAALGLLGLQKPGGYRRGGQLLLWTGAIAVLFSVFLAWASTQLGKWCLFCISLYGVNVLLLVAGFLWSRREEAAAELPGWGQDGALRTMIGTGAVVLIAAMLWYGQAEKEQEGPVVPSDPNTITSDQLAGLFMAPKGQLILDGTEPIYGDPAAPYTLVEFADYECPYCGQVAPELKKLVDDNKDIRLLFKHYPLDQNCNENMGRPLHENACGAAAAAECARQQQQFWEMNRLMFQNQDFLSGDNLLFLAQQAGLNADAFKQCLADPLTAAAVQADIAHATQAGVGGTPALFVRGIRGEEWVMLRGHTEQAAALIGAHRSGKEIPPTPPFNPEM